MKRRRVFRKPYRIKRKKSIFKNRFFWLIVLFLIVLGALIYFFIFSSVFQVKEITISGNNKVEKEQIESKIESHLERKLIFPTKSIFLVELDKIKEDILDTFASIVDIEIGRGFPDTIAVSVTERVAIANFCQDNKCFLIDSEGVIFERSLLESSLFRITDKKDDKMLLNLGKEVIEKEYLEKIFKIQRNISEEFDFRAEEFIVFNERLNVKTNENWESYFDPKEYLNWQLTKLNFVLKEKIPPERRKDLEYIELRFGDLAPFKYR
jgi:hypothetical protein